MFVSFIGGGNMANAIIGGLKNANVVDISKIVVSDPYLPTRQTLEKNYNVKTTENNNDTIHCQGIILILAVKPQVMKTVAQGISENVLKFKPLIITIAAGITIPDLSRWLQSSGSTRVVSIVRCMPNTPALVGEGATGVFANQAVTDLQKEQATLILASISKSLYWVESESLIDVVTGLSGSGPAYFFLIVEALEEAAVELGLSMDVARGLAAQTCMGAGKMLIANRHLAPSELRRNVTSPNGTTEAAIGSLQESGIRNIMSKAVQAATDRAKELGKILGEQL